MSSLSPTLRSTHRRVLQWSTFARIWWIYDANFQCPIKSSDVIVHYLRGLHKPIFHPRYDYGDHVVVINTQKIAMEGERWRTFKFFWHSGYPGGLRTTRAYQMHQFDPTMVLRKMVYNTLPGSLLRKQTMERLHLYHDDNVPSEILRNVTQQIRQVMPIPKGIDDYSKEEIKTFPKLFDYPDEHVIDSDLDGIR